MSKGSNIAKGGFKAEQVLVDFLNSKDGPATIASNNICPLHEIKALKARRLGGRKKTDVCLTIDKVSGESIRINFSVKKSTIDFSQLERGKLEKYQAALNVPEKVNNLLKFFLGRVSPKEYNPVQNFKDSRRLFLNELKEKDQKNVINFFNSVKKKLIRTAFLGSDLTNSPDYLVTIDKENAVPADFKDAKFTPIEKAIQIALANGEVSFTKGGSLKIGKVTIQRKGGDGGKPSACDLQIKFCPSDYHE